MNDPTKAWGRPPAGLPEEMAWVERLRWGSHQVHLFAVSNPVRSAGSLVVSLLALVTVNGGALGVVWLVGRVLPKVAAGLAAALAVAGVLRYLWLLSRPLWARRKDIRLDMQTRMRPLLATLALFALAYLAASPASGLWRGFTPGDSPPAASEWADFFSAQVADALLFDVADGLGWGSTRLEPTTLTAIVVTAGLHILFGIGLCEVAITVWRTALGREQFYATVPECWVRMVARNDFSGQLELVGSVAPVEPVDEVEVGLFRRVLAEVAARKKGSGFSSWEES